MVTVPQPGRAAERGIHAAADDDREALSMHGQRPKGEVDQLVEAALER